jgi:putative membrane protein
MAPDDHGGSVRQVTLTVSSLLILASLAHAHDGKPHRFEDLWGTWAWDPLVLATLAISGSLYVIGLSKVWSAAGRGHGIGVRQSLFFGAGWLSLFVALVSPLHPWGEVLFSVHMTQHEVLMLFAAPLVVLGRPQVATAWAIPVSWKCEAREVIKSRVVRSSWRFLTKPLAAWAIHAAALWVWHIPFLFEATLKSDLVHACQHASFFGSAMIFWWSIIFGTRGASTNGAGVLYLFTTSIHSGLLGVILTLTNRVLYPSYSEYSAAWGLTPIEDQQIGGLIMWIPAGIVYIIAALIMFTGWLRESENSVRRRELRSTQTPILDK